MTTNHKKNTDFERKKNEIRFKGNFLQKSRNPVTNGNNLFQVLKSLKST